MPNFYHRAVSTGPEPHIHHFRHDPLNPLGIVHREMALPPGEVFGVASFDEACTIGECMISYISRAALFVLSPWDIALYIWIRC